MMGPILQTGIATMLITRPGLRAARTETPALVVSITKAMMETMMTASTNNEKKPYGCIPKRTGSPPRKSHKEPVLRRTRRHPSRTHNVARLPN